MPDCTADRISSLRSLPIDSWPGLAVHCRYAVGNAITSASKNSRPPSSAAQTTDHPRRTKRATSSSTIFKWKHLLVVHFTFARSLYTPILPYRIALSTHLAMLIAYTYHTELRSAYRCRQSEKKQVELNCCPGNAIRRTVGDYKQKTWLSRRFSIAK